MPVHERGGGGHVAVEHRRHDRPVLGVHVAHLRLLGVPVEQAQLPETLGMVGERRPESQQPLRAAGADEREVKATMLGLPGRGRLPILGPRRQGRARQQVHGGHDVGFPRRIASLDGGGQAQSLDVAPRRHEIGQRLGRDVGDPRPAMRLRIHEALGGQAHQRLADRRQSEGEAVLKVGGGEAVAGHQVPVEDLLPQPAIGAFRVRSSCGGFGHRGDGIHVDRLIL